MPIASGLPRHRPGRPRESALAKRRRRRKWCGRFSGGRVHPDEAIPRAAGGEAARCGTSDSRTHRSQPVSRFRQKAPRQCSPRLQGPAAGSRPSPWVSQAAGCRSSRPGPRVRRARPAGQSQECGELSHGHRMGRLLADVLLPLALSAPPHKSRSHPPAPHRPGRHHSSDHRTVPNRARRSPDIAQRGAARPCSRPLLIRHAAPAGEPDPRPGRRGPVQDEAVGLRGGGTDRGGGTEFYRSSPSTPGQRGACTSAGRRRRTVPQRGACADVMLGFSSKRRAGPTSRPWCPVGPVPDPFEVSAPLRAHSCAASARTCIAEASVRRRVLAPRVFRSPRRSPSGMTCRQHVGTWFPPLAPTLLYGSVISTVSSQPNFTFSPR